jgi:hypothetical protein
MGYLSTEQLGRLLVILRDTPIKGKNGEPTSLMEENEDIWVLIKEEWLDRVESS